MDIKTFYSIMHKCFGKEQESIMNTAERLKEYGVNVSEALERFMGNEKLFLMTLKKFSASVEAHEVREKIISGDRSTAIANAHTLKGVTGNLSMTPLYEAYVEIVQSLKNGENEKALARLDGILPLQEKIIDCINDADRS